MLDLFKKVNPDKLNKSLTFSHEHFEIQYSFERNSICFGVAHFERVDLPSGETFSSHLATGTQRFSLLMFKTFSGKPFLTGTTSKALETAGSEKTFRVPKADVSSPASSFLLDFAKALKLHVAAPFLTGVPRYTHTH